MRPVMKELPLVPYSGDLRAMCYYIDSLSFSAVKTKYNAKRQWEAISLRGFSDDPTNILKPNVLKSGLSEGKLQDTYLRTLPELSPLHEIINQLPTEFERIRIMRLRAGTSISKHTDKVDKSIGFDDGEIVRIHIPIRTDPSVMMTLWDKKTPTDYHLKQGYFYYTDVTRAHAVQNPWDQDRLHLVVDCFSSQTMRDMILTNN